MSRKHNEIMKFLIVNLFSISDELFENYLALDIRE